jgi:glutaredoxin 3
MKAIVWSKPDCPNCTKAHTLLKNKGIEIEERKLGFGWNREQLFEVVPNARSVPQIFIDENHIGGYDDLVKYLEAK